MDQVQVLLQQLKQNYILEMPDRLDKLEHLVLALERDGFSDELFHELYRQVHSLKGSGGTYGLHVLTNICHPFEDFLSMVGNENDLPNAGFANVALAYLDLLREVSERIARNTGGVFDIDKMLEDLRQRTFAPRFHAILVENSTTVVKLVTRILRQYQFRVAVQDDGYVTLGRMLGERFDLLITAQEIKQLNGLALIAAVKMAGAGHQMAKTILLTSNSITTPSELGPDFTLNKNDQLSLRMHTLLKSIVQDLSTSH